MSKQDVYTAKMKLELDELNAKMHALDQKAKEVKDDMRQAYQDEVHKVKKQSTLALAKLEELKSAGSDSWESMVSEMDKVRDAFTHSFHYFKSQLK